MRFKFTKASEPHGWRCGVQYEPRYRRLAIGLFGRYVVFIYLRPWWWDI